MSIETCFFHKIAYMHLINGVNIFFSVALLDLQFVVLNDIEAFRVWTANCHCQQHNFILIMKMEKKAT